MSKYHDSDDVCDGCGSTLEDREKYAKQNPDGDTHTGLTSCNYCDTAKCAMCDMGADVMCSNCINED